MSELGAELNTVLLSRYRIVISFFAWLSILHVFGQTCHANESTITIADATESKDWTTVAKLINDDVDVNAAQADGMTALHWAVFAGHREVVAQLIDAKCEVDTPTRYGIRPLTIACSLGHSQLVHQLLAAGADANSEQPGDVTPLMVAARSGDEQSIRELLEHGAKINAVERKGQTALMWAAAYGNADAVGALIDGGADLNQSIKSGFTAMTFAAREGHIGVVDRLIGAGVDVSAAMKPETSGNRAPRKGTSALILAVESGHFELAMRLIDYGADPNDQRSGFAPLHVVTWVRKPNRGEDPSGDPSPRGSGNLTSMQFVRAIIAAGADVNLKLKRGKSGKAFLNHTGATPLLLAGKTADLELIKALVELGGDPLTPNADGCTPLMAAAGIGVRAVGEEAGTEDEVIEVIEFLIAQGADVNTVDANKETAMHGAAYRNFPRVVNFLAANGADPDKWDHKNVSGWTPVMIAQGKRPGSFKPSPPTVAALRAAKSVSAAKSSIK
ncbi:MAG: hypothetical protein HKN47_27495 [Pirellulaceae bacterium]|nr:hypothetical protein [Pirellulaceae bacterium]